MFSLSFHVRLFVNPIGICSHCASRLFRCDLFLQRISACFQQQHLQFMFYVAWERHINIGRKDTWNWIRAVRLKMISRNMIWVGFQTTFECILKQICKNYFMDFFCHLHMLNMIRFQLAMHKNRFGPAVWTGLAYAFILLTKGRASVRWEGPCRTCQWIDSISPTAPSR